MHNKNFHPDYFEIPRGQKLSLNALLALVALPLP